MRILYLLALLFCLLFAENIKIYLYIPAMNTSDFKSLKINFDTYLHQYGDYELQPFNDRDIFEYYLRSNSAVVIISSWHYNEIATTYHLHAHLVGRKNGSITDQMVLVGPRNSIFQGVVTSAFNPLYTQNLLQNIPQHKKFSVLQVPKEIDALMSVGFGMSAFALVSKESFSLFQTLNPALAKDLNIHNELQSQYRMFLASNSMDESTQNIIEIFKTMDQSQEGEAILNIIGMDQLTPFEPLSHNNIEDIR